MTVSAEDILRRVMNLGCASGYCVAFSGGPDSHALLHALASTRGELSGPLRAVHVNHRLRPQADSWAVHCDSVCRSLAIPLAVHTAARPGAGAGETWAREQRYALFAELLQPGEMLMTAHHRDDQAETVMLRLLRGSGVDGLAGIPPLRGLGAGQVGRPLLDLPRSALREYARTRGLESIEDPGNADLGADRNFVRHRVLPLLAERWPGSGATMARTAELLRQEQQVMADHAAAFLPRQPHGPLHWPALMSLGEGAQRIVLRQWLRRAGLPVPEARQLEAGRRMLLLAGADRQPEFTWPGGRVRRYRELLHAEPMASEFAPLGSDAGSAAVTSWSLENDLPLPGGWLRRSPGEGGLDTRCLPDGQVTVAFRQGGEWCRPAGRPRRPVKKLFQEAGVPPWQRGHWPLLMAGEEIAAVPGVCICEGFQVAPPQRGLHLLWEPREGGPDERR